MSSTVGTAGSNPTRRKPARRGSGEALRAEIIEAASALLAESGDVETMSLRAVARRVGIATTSIYLHFADVDELILAVKAKRFAELSERLRAALEEVGDRPIDRVRAIGHAYVSFGMANPGHYRVMFSASLKGMVAAPTGLVIGLEAYRVLAAEVAAALGTAMSDPVTDVVATSLWAFVHGVVHLRTARPRFPWPAREVMVDDLVDRMFAAHRNPSEAAPDSAPEQRQHLAAE